MGHQTPVAVRDGSKNKGQMDCANMKTIISTVSLQDSTEGGQTWNRKYNKVLNKIGLLIKRLLIRD